MLDTGGLSGGKHSDQRDEQLGEGGDILDDGPSGARALYASDGGM